MRKEVRGYKLGGVPAKVELLFIEESDRKKLQELYNYWKVLNNGMKLLMSRGINLPEGISESAFCLCFNKNTARAITAKSTSGSFDVLDLKTLDRIQIKACSVKNELTSFGPKSVWDKLYFMDFFREGKYDGSFDVYEIPNNLIYNHKVNAKQTFRQQQSQGRRPRFSIKKEIIKEYNIEPIKTCKL